MYVRVRAFHPMTVFTAIVFGLFGAVLLWGGLQLLHVGGSAYYLVAGLLTLLSALLLLCRSRLGVYVFSLLLIGTTAWAVWEVRLDWWQLLTRLDLWFGLGLWLLLPWSRRGLSPGRFTNTARGTGGGVLFLSLLLMGAVGAAGALQPNPDLRGDLQMADVAGPEGDRAMRPDGDWTDYGGSPYGQRYSPLSQVNADNVHRLEVAWKIQTGDRPGPDDPTETTDENTPIKIGDTVYICTPHSRVIAVDAATGTQRWAFDPHLQSPVGFKHWEHMTCRGVSYHDDAKYAATTPAPASTSAPAAASTAWVPTATASAVCPRRIFLPTADARLIALDADTGKPCADFGNQGTVDLRANIGPFTPGGYYSTSPPAVTRNLVIISGHVTDNESTNEPSGVIRAFDVHDGHLVWNWDPGKPDDTAPIAPGETYTRNSPNVWSVFSVDENLGMVYLPMGNQTPDQFAGTRTPTSEKYGAGVVALDVATGKVRWNYQFTHHDLWDMDIGGQPTLIDLKTSDGMKPALVASTKQGSIYVLDRRDGTPIVPIHEVPRPQGAVPGDHTSPTQPMSDLNFAPADLREKDMWGTTPLDQLWCRVRFRSLRYEGMFTPPSEQGSLVYPGNFGVFDWGGVSVDPTRQLLLLNPSYMAFQSRLIPKEQLAKMEVSEPKSETQGIKQAKGIPYGIELSPFLSPLGIPCQAPPWGYVAGVDLGTGRTMWKHKNGTIVDSAPLPIPMPLGVPSLGGMLTTAGGVTFLSGTLDDYIRGYDVRTGEKLWEARLPAGGQATPMSYSDASGRQYILVVAGGHGSLGTKQGDWVIAYALPK
ncbi:glucose/quinate/shikimate family membrane-bound PQQ-dependent dehydrogenase [Luteibacter sahnii]|uniref:glucose/quinate/shikimate family membrane-bound PQQ-dependent dehydrogenase n=1 Tax=Luteibacter sahnii TaxID=3021977 RepID=UPI002A6AC339|nr:glucose/quinate/shikimate family membrane-bound PQQ-dependent dehydrogenase [Luteibacter sp. PPL193]MDY1548984.1 glucose/quinate/shikimate family membrane-bound PQQ-dependent dehydrogenase [Luteibacter sp. PPL193]